VTLHQHHHDHIISMHTNPCCHNVALSRGSYAVTTYMCFGQPICSFLRFVMALSCLAGPFYVRCMGTEYVLDIG